MVVDHQKEEEFNFINERINMDKKKEPLKELYEILDKKYLLSLDTKERLETEASQLGFNSLRLETGIYQPEALALFRARGFAPRLSFGDYPDNDPNSIFMEKQMSS